MPAHTLDANDEWSPSAVLVAAAAVGQFAWSLAALTGYASAARIAIFAAVAVAVALMVAAARCRMPLAIKSALIVVLLASVMLLFAAKDLAGLRQLMGSAEPVLGATDRPPPRVTVSGGFDPEAGRAAGVVAGQLEGAGGAVGVELSPDGTGGIGWRVRRGTAERWCGTYREANPAAVGAYRALAERAAEAAAASNGGPLDCG